MNNIVNPCPFCGESDNITITSKEVFNEFNYFSRKSTVCLMCEKCNARLYETSDKTYEKLCSDLLNRWNNRFPATKGKVTEYGNISKG